ncbi:MAG: hypothetical protein LC775_14085 [Acidobacteria bacterium]|nr:hypothetical protein [Acidobacteriota bacterium]
MADHVHRQFRVLVEQLRDFSNGWRRFGLEVCLVVIEVDAVQRDVAGRGDVLRHRGRLDGDHFGFHRHGIDHFEEGERPSVRLLVGLERPGGDEDGHIRIALR